MIRKLLVTTVAAVGLVGMVGVPSAGAIMLPAGDGTVSCAIGGTVKVARPAATPAVVKVVVAGKIAACSYNGNALPFVTGATRSVTVSNPAAACAALADGSASAKMSVTVKVGGIKSVSVSVNVEVDVSPSPPGSLIEASGSATVKSIALSANVVAQTDRPVADLCSGTKVVAFGGTASLSWDRP